MENTKHLFFDLDRTLWDYEKNAAEVLAGLHDSFLREAGAGDTETFTTVFHRENGFLWAAFAANRINKEYLRKFRFYNTLSALGISDFGLSAKLEEVYLQLTPSQTKLFPGVHQTLEVLQKSYPLHIITNGFEDVQQFKLENSGIRKYFTTVVTSDSAQARKPDRRIFDYSLSLAKAHHSEAIIIGDDLEVDVLGAQSAGWEGIFFNPGKTKHQVSGIREIEKLTELLEIF